MIGLKRSLSRRTLLRGTGTALALPLLDAMVPAMAATHETLAASDALQRIGYVYIPMGYNAAAWRPEGAGDGAHALDKLPPSLRSLESVKSHLSVLTGIGLQNAYPGSHATSNAAFLSAAPTKQNEMSDDYLGTTVDQIAARHLGQQTQLPSLELAMDSMNPIEQCDNGYADGYHGNLSWASATEPLPSVAHPRTLFENLFGDGRWSPDQQAAVEQRASLLDSVTGDIKRLNLSLGAQDRNSVSDYLESIREVELRIQFAEDAVAENPLPDLDRPSGAPAEYAEHAALMFELQRLALQGDITRVVTFQLAREGSTRTYPEIGVAEPHHALSHHGNDPEKLAKVAKINAFHVSLFANFLQKLAATPEGNGTLLDHTLYLYGSGMGDGYAHDHTDLPILLAGGAAGKQAGGQHVCYERNTPLAELHRTLLNQVGVPMETFASSGGQGTLVQV